jgi:hypothetical protein
MTEEELIQERTELTTEFHGIGEEHSILKTALDIYKIQLSRCAPGNGVGGETEAAKLLEKMGKRVNTLWAEMDELKSSIAVTSRRINNAIDLKHQEQLSAIQARDMGEEVVSRVRAITQLHEVTHHNALGEGGG